MSKVSKLAWLVAGVAGFAALSVANYRRFMPAPKSMGTRSYPVEVQKLPIQAQAHTLYGEMLRPKGISGQLPTVICCHGFGSSYRLCKETMGMCLAKSGLQVYCFDFYGGNKKSKSGGSMMEMSIFTEREDLCAIIDQLRELPYVDHDNLFLLGESQGGCVCGITAPEFRDRLKGMVLYYPAFCIPEDARKRYSSTEQIPAVEDVFGQTVGKIYSEKLLDYDVYENLLPFEKPVLIIHGDHDRVVDISYGRKAAETYPNADFQCLPGEDHGFSSKGKMKAAKLSYNFIQTLIEE